MRIEKKRTSTVARGGAAMRFTTGSTFLRPSSGVTRNTNFLRSRPSSWKKADRVWAMGDACAPVGRPHHVQDEAGRALGVARHLARRRRFSPTRIT